MAERFNLEHITFVLFYECCSRGENAVLGWLPLEAVDFRVGEESLFSTRCEAGRQDFGGNQGGGSQASRRQ